MIDKIYEMILTYRVWCISHFSGKSIHRVVRKIGRLVVYAILFLVVAICVFLILRLLRELRMQQLYDELNKYNTFA